MPTPVSIDLERWGRAKIYIGLLACVVIGGGALVAAATGGVRGGTASTVIAVVLGALILLLGVGICLGLLLAPPRASVTLDASGVHHERAGRADWTLAWSDLGAVEVTHSALRVEQRGVSTTGGYLHPSADVTVPRDWLRLTAVAAAAARPDVAVALRADGAGEPGTIALDLGPDPRNGEAVRAALTSFAPPALITHR